MPAHMVSQAYGSLFNQQPRIWTLQAVFQKRLKDLLDLGGLLPLVLQKCHVSSTPGQGCHQGTIHTILYGDCWSHPTLSALGAKPRSELEHQVEKGWPNMCERRHLPICSSSFCWLAFAAGKTEVGWEGSPGQHSLCHQCPALLWFPGNSHSPPLSGGCTSEMPKPQNSKVTRVPVASPIFTPTTGIPFFYW